MPDASRAPFPPPAPADWGDAFAMLPLEAPAPSAWPAVSARLAVRPRHHRRDTHPLAMAAALGAVLLVPVLAWRAAQAPDAPAPRGSSAPVASAERTPIAQVRTALPDAPAASETAVSRTARVGEIDGGPSVAALTPRDSARLAHAASPRRARPRVVGQPSSGRRDDRPAMASTAAIRTSTAPSETSLLALQDESARLEQWLRATGADDAASAPSLVLAAALDDDLQRIDGALAADGLDVPARSALWTARVDALRGAAALQTAQRWRDAQGVSMDAALVRVD